MPSFELSLMHLMVTILSVPCCSSPENRRDILGVLFLLMEMEIMLESLLQLDLDLTLTLLSLLGLSLREGNFSPTGDLVLLLLVVEGDLNLSQKFIELSALFLQWSLMLDLDLDFISGEVIEED